MAEAPASGECGSAPVSSASEPCCADSAPSRSELLAMDIARNRQIVQNIDSSERFQILLNYLHTQLNVESDDVTSDVTSTMKLCAFGELETVYGDLKRKFTVPCTVQTSAARPATVCDFKHNNLGDVCDVLKEVNRYLQQINYVSALGPHCLYLIDTKQSMKVRSRDTGEEVPLTDALALTGYGIPMAGAGIKPDSSNHREVFVVYSFNLFNLLPGGDFSQSNDFERRFGLNPGAYDLNPGAIEKNPDRFIDNVLGKVLGVDTKGFI